MTNLKRINDRFTMRESEGESDAYRKFNHQFSQLFNSSDKPRDDDEFYELYVHDVDFEASLEEFRHSMGNMTRFVVGYTGIGKSTTIRYVFSIGMKRRAFFNEKTGELVFPTFLDGFQEREDGTFNLVGRIKAVNTMLKRKVFPELSEYLRTDEGKADLYGFIEEYAGYLLEDYDAIDELDWTEDESVKNRLRYASERDSFEYHATVMKYLIAKKYNVIKRLVIILDDIETFSDEYQETIISSFLKFNDCMSHTKYPSRRSHESYVVNLLISMRPHTFRRHITGRYKDRGIEAFSKNMAIKKMHPVDLIKLFWNRFEYYTKGITIGEKTSWDECYGELCVMLDKFESLNGKYNGQYTNMISGLCFEDIRVTLSWYARVFANRQWVQRGVPKYDAFTVKSSEFIINNQTVIRALSCKENEVFFDNSSDIVPNPFLTTHKKDYGVLSLMVLRYYYLKTRHDEYGADPEYEAISKVLKFWKAVSGKSVANDVRKIINYYYDIKLLRPSIRNTEEWLVDNGHSSKFLTDDKILYLSPRGFQLYEMLGRDSILFELIREASYRDFSWLEFNSRSSLQLRSTGERSELFIDLLNYLLYLCEKEEEIVKGTLRRGKHGMFSSVFGSVSICEYILQGIENSLRYTGIMHEDENIPILLTEVSERVLQLTKV